MIVEGVFHGQVQWGYFSGKDGESHSFDLCETCYDKWIAAFQIPVERNLENELLEQKTRCVMISPIIEVKTEMRKIEC